MFKYTFINRFSKKTPYAKPIPKTFQAAWNSAGDLEDVIDDDNPVVSYFSKHVFSKAGRTNGITFAKISLVENMIVLK